MPFYLIYQNAEPVNFSVLQYIKKIAFAAPYQPKEMHQYIIRASVSGLPTASDFHQITNDRRNERERFLADKCGNG
jgi:hypothetical protein